MSDIVERLRIDYGEQWCESEPNTVIDQYRNERHEAADEIERLCTLVKRLQAESDAWQKGAMEAHGEINTLRAKWGIETDESLTECVERNIDGWKQRALKYEAP